jgi:hypothetical protein
MTLQTLRVNYHFVTDRFGYSSLDQFLRLQKVITTESGVFKVEHMARNIKNLDLPKSRRLFGYP